jgi:hypothetical protein
LTLARLLAILRVMSDACRTVAVPRSALSARRDLLLEILALRHQLGVLARSDRRFRPSDRLLWVCLRWLWPRWRDALVLVQPATVARWHRQGFRGCWRRRSRRPGRPRIDRISFTAAHVDVSVLARNPPKWAVEPTLVAYGCGLLTSGDSISPEGPNDVV